MPRTFPKQPVAEAPKEFGLDVNTIQTRRILLDTAQTLKAEEIGGTCIWAYNASSLTAEVDIRVNDQLRAAIPFKRGQFVNGIPFSRLYVSNTAQAGEWIDLFVAVEQQVGKIDIVNPSALAQAVELTKATEIRLASDRILAAGAKTIITSIGATGRSVNIRSLDSNIAELRIGDTNVTATTGEPLFPGEKKSIECIESVYAWNPAGVVQKLSLFNIRD